MCKRARLSPSSTPYRQLPAEPPAGLKNGPSQRAATLRPSAGRSAALPRGFATVEAGEGDADTHPLTGTAARCRFRYSPPTPLSPHLLAVKGLLEPRLQGSAKHTLQPLPSTNRCAAAVVVIVAIAAAVR